MRSSVAARIHLLITSVLVTSATACGVCVGLLLGGRLTAALAGGAAGLGAGIGAFLSRRHVFAYLRPEAAASPSATLSDPLAAPVPAPAAEPAAGPSHARLPVPAGAAEAGPDTAGPQDPSVHADPSASSDPAASSGPSAPSDRADATGGYAEGLADAVVVSIATYQAAAFPLTALGVSDEERAARRAFAYRVCAQEGLPPAVRVSAAAALEAVDQGVDAGRAHAAMKALSLTVYDHRGAR
ncbi:hypothetical protein AB0O18_28210 [Streptomyces sp. NPDC093224]|uniref:hypothetical protein n=1 Tax=Streptomyces sp. NPDC093224 TaxID=3155198 RepID=UPI00341CA156